MKGPELVRGEQLLRFLLPSGWNLVPMMRRSVVHVAVMGGGGTALTGLMALAAGTAAPILGMVVLLLGLGLVAALTVGVVIWRRPRPIRWWVTTRRLVVHVGKEVHEIDLDAIESVDASVALDELVVTVDDQEWCFGPVNALGELWGAIRFGQAWNAPHIEVGEVQVHGANAFRWAETREGLTRIRGVLSLRPDHVVWLPESVIASGSRALGELAGLTVGAKLLRVTALPPLERFATLMCFATDPELLDRETRRVVAATGGWFAPLGDITWSFEDTTLVVEYEGCQYRSARVPDVDRAALEKSWLAPEAGGP